MTVGAGGLIATRLLIVAVSMLVTFGVAAAIVWFTVFSGDGVSIDTGSGGTSSTAVGGATAPGDPTGGGASLPTGWPEAFTPPAGAVVRSSVATAPGGPDEQLVVVYEVDLPVTEAADVIRAQLVGAGLTVTSDSVTPDGSTASLQAAGAGRDATVAISTLPSTGTTTVSWVLRPES